MPDHCTEEEDDKTVTPNPLHHHGLQQEPMNHRPDDAVAARRWATETEVAQHLKVHPNTIARWASEGRIPRHRIGPRLVRYDLNEIDAAMDTSETREED